MKLTDLLKGKLVNVTTDAKIVVQLEIEKVVEHSTKHTKVLEPDTRENDWWGTSIDYTETKYIVTFTNGFSKEYTSIEKIPFVE